MPIAAQHVPDLYDWCISCHGYQAHSLLTTLKGTNMLCRICGHGSFFPKERHRG